MNKIIISFLVLFTLASCGEVKTGNNIEVTNTGVKLGDTNISSGSIGVKDNINITSTGIEVKDKIKNIDNNEEKDVIVIKNNDNDFDGKTQQEVIDEMEDYVNDLFNMIEEDVK